MLADGKKIAILVLANRGNPEDMTEKQFGWRNTVGAWMEKDLLRILNKAGYDARLIEKREDYGYEQGTYLLSIAITSYNPGSAAARILVGFGAGAMSLDTHYELFGEGDNSLLADDFGTGSSRSWSHCARKINQHTAKAVTDKLTQIHQGAASPKI